jgi:hypothetical protein
LKKIPKKSKKVIFSEPGHISEPMDVDIPEQYQNPFEINYQQLKWM